MHCHLGHFEFSKHFLCGYHLAKNIFPKIVFAKQVLPLTLYKFNY